MINGEICAAGFHAALRSLRAQFIERGMDPTLRGVVAFLAEDGMTVLLFASYAALDDPPAAGFTLPRKVSEGDFDHAVYEYLAEHDAGYGDLH